MRADSPDAPAAVSFGSFTNSTGYTHYHETGAGGTAKLLARPGVAYRLSTGSTPGTGQVVLSEAVHLCHECGTDRGPYPF